MGQLIDVAKNGLGPCNHSVQIDFAGATGTDSSTASHLNEAINQQLGGHVRIGIIDPR